MAINKWWIFLVVGLMLAACTPQPDAPDLTADEIKNRAAETMAALKSLHFTIELTGALTYIDPTRILALKRAEGDIVAPDRVAATIRTRTFGSTTDISVVGVGTQQWARNPASGQWEALPPEYGTFDMGALFNNEYGLSGLLRTQSFTKQPNETVENQTHYVLATQTPGATLNRMTSGMITQGNVDVKLWINSETMRVSQIVLTELDTDPEEPTRWQITLSAFDQPVDIAPPATQ